MNNYQLMRNLLLLVLLVNICSSLQIVIPETKHIDLQIDQIYSQSIPSFFQLYQAASIKKFARVESPQQTLANSQICTIQDDQDNQYIEEQSQYYHSHLADPERFYLGHKKAASFNDLLKLTGIVDTITFDSNKIIVLFQNGFYTCYSINPTNGKITPQFVRHLLQSDKMNINASQYETKVHDRVVGFGDFLYDKASNPQHIIFFGEQQALIMNKTTKIFESLKGYDVIGQSYQKATMVRNKIYVGTGFQGVFVYEVDASKKQIKLTQTFRPYYKNSQEQEVYIAVSQVIYDPIANKLILADLSEGIYWVDIPSQLSSSSTQQNKILCQPKPILIQNCENMNLMTQQQTGGTPILIATCPQLLIVALDNKSHRIVDEISFYPHTVVTNSSRVLLFGQYKYAVYDLATNLVQQGEGERKIDFVTFYQEYIVIVNIFAVYVGRIYAETQKIVCAANDDNQNIDNKNDTAAIAVGKYQFILQIQGICSQLYTPEFITHTNPNNALLPSTQTLSIMPQQVNIPQPCFVKYKIELSINDTSKMSYFWQIVAGILIVWVLVVGLIAYCVKDIKIDKEYNKLIEENVNSSTDKNKSMAIQESQKVYQVTNQKLFQGKK